MFSPLNVLSRKVTNINSSIKVSKYWTEFCWYTYVSVNWIQVLEIIDLNN